MAVLSGKGGAGKTSFSSAMALSHPLGRPVATIDCDVEEPNLALLLQEPQTINDAPEEPMAATIPFPTVDPERCSRCGVCSKTCNFGGVFCFGGSLPTFNHLCHGCGACVIACPNGALRETERQLGIIRRGRIAKGRGTLIEGRLTVGMPNPVPVIDLTLKVGLFEGLDSVIDAPPGVSCPTVAVLRHANAVILIMENTPFGRADGQAAAQLIRDLGKPGALVINRSGIIDEEPLEGILAELPLIATLPFSRDVAAGSARGIPPAALDRRWAQAARSAWDWAMGVFR
ncbi:MAG: 4Fe-4S binding protein [Thermanaerothrix sp.]|nr:4Fe-4S binding protein [Thermanaerothrix sp.]